MTESPLFTVLMTACISAGISAIIGLGTVLINIKLYTEILKLRELTGRVK